MHISKEGHEGRAMVRVKRKCEALCIVYMHLYTRIVYFLIKKGGRNTDSELEFNLWGAPMEESCRMK